MLAAVLVLSSLAGSQTPATTGDWQAEIPETEPNRSPVAMWPAGKPVPTAEELEARSLESERRLDGRMDRLRGEGEGCGLISTDFDRFEDIVILSSSSNFQVTRVYYIDATAPVGGDGLSWDTAFQSVQDAIVSADYEAEVVEFRIAGGLYRADRVNGENTFDPDQTIELPGVFINPIAKDDVAGVKHIKGGYAGRGTRNPDERDLDLYPTIFTGDLLGDDDPQNFANYDDNTKVLFLPKETELNGITIEHARIAANELRWMTDCTVRFCFASGDDLPLDREARSPVFAREARIVGNLFHNNRGEQYGGALTVRGLSAVANCRFLQNEAVIGGAIGVEFFEDATLLVQNSYFAANQADSETGGVGGAVFNGNLSTEAATQFAHCVFAGNEAIDGLLGAATSATGRSVFYNSVFDQNFSANGTGVEVETGSLFLGNQSSSLTIIRRSVFRAYNENLETSSAYPRVALNREANPGFHNLLGPDGVLGTLDDDPSLGDESACIGWSTTTDDLPAGYVDLVLLDLADLDGDCQIFEPIPVDLLGNPRTIGDGADAGCIEYIPGGPARPITDWSYIDPQVTDFSTEPIRLYVDAKSKGGDGSSWATALSNPSEALAVAASRLGPVEIWVASGKYLPQVTRSGIDSFRLSENVTMLGGFVGTETLADQRDPALHETVLTGDYLDNDDPASRFSFVDNARQVVVSIGPRGGGTIDGFTVQSGTPTIRLVGGLQLFYDPLGSMDTSGVLYVASGDVEFRSCSLGPWSLAVAAADSFQNRPLIGLQGADSSIRVADSVVRHGLIENSGFAAPLDSDRFYIGVKPGFGRGFAHLDRVQLRLEGSFPGSIINTGLVAFFIDAGSVVISESTAKSDRALVFRAIDSGGLEVKDSTLESKQGVGFLVGRTDVTVSSSTILGDAVAFLGGSGGLSEPTFRVLNSICAAGDDGMTVSENAFSASASVFPDSFAIGTLPLVDETNTTFDFESNAATFFADPLGPDGVPYTGDEDLRLTPGSPAINTGLNEFVTSDFDLDGNPRIIGSVVDRGAYEFTGTCTGDVNGDGVIDLADLNRVLANYEQGTPFGDADGDGSVGMTDLNIVLAAFGNVCPEP